MPSTPLKGRIALVAGATRGAGRGIAKALGEAGATVYCTGRTTRSKPRATPAAGTDPFDLSQRIETIEDTAELVTAQGGKGIAVAVDHTDEVQVEALARRIEADFGRLDLLVNDVWGGDSLVEWGTPCWALDIDKGRTLLDRGVMSHVITARHTIPLLKLSDRGLLVEVTDGESMAYRHNLFYDLVKTTVIRLAYAFAEELRPHEVASVALTPGFLRSEAMLEHFGVTEDTWREGGQTDPNFLQSESTLFVGRAIAAMASDPQIFAHTGKSTSSWALARAYGFTDADGQTPDWGRHADSESFGADQKLAHKRFVDAFDPWA